MCNEWTEALVTTSVPEWREARAPGASPPPINTLALMWTDTSSHNGQNCSEATQLQGGPDPSCSPCPDRGESKGSGTRTSKDRHQGVRRGDKALERPVTGGGCAGADVQSGRGGLRDVREPQDTGPEVRERRKKAKGPCFLVGWEGQGKGTITQETAQGGLGWRKGEGGLQRGRGNGTQVCCA